MKFTSAAILAASASTATALTNPFANSTLGGGCGACKQFTINVARGATDGSKGLSRDAILTNGTLPGPALNLKVGECVDFTVINNIGDSTGVHFHGIRQLDTPWSDGTPGLSQKAIGNGETYTYRWLADEPGVYFYHSHYKSQMMDGLYGAIVISAAEGTAKPFASIGDSAALEAAEAKVETVFTSDWNQFTAAEFLDIQKQANIDDACTDSIILNGYGSVYCYTQAELAANQRPQVPFILAPNTTLTAKGCIPANNGLIQGNYTRNLDFLPPGAYDSCTAYKGGEYVYEVDAADEWAAMSFISPSGFTLLVATIDGHKFYVYEVNGQYIEPQVVDQITITPGDRISFFVKLDQPAAEYKIRVANDGLNQVISGFGTLKYKGASGPGSAPAIMNVGGVSPPNSTVVALNNALAVPYSAPAVSTKADRTFVLDIMKNPGAKESWQWVLNGVEPYSQDNDDQTPFLFSGPAGVPESDLVLRTNYNEWVDLIIKVAGPLAQPHPIHKHANKFYVIGSGVGAFNYSTVAEAQSAGVAFNLANPPYLDGFTSQPAQGSGTWMVFRYQANTPGAWFMHCHIQTHFSGGMAVAILDGVDKWPSVPVNPGHLGDICSANNSTTGPIGGGNGSIGGNGTSPIGGGNGNNGTIGGGNGNGSGSGTTTTTGTGSGATTTTGSSSSSTSSHWGGWGDWTYPAGPDATKVPNKGTGRPAVPTGANGGDINYDGSDWEIWSSIESKASSLSKNGGVATTVYGNDPAAWGNWNDAATTTLSTKTKATGSAKNSGKPVDPTATGTWSAWDPANTASSVNGDWSSWAGADGSSSVKGSTKTSTTVKATGSSTWASWDPSNTVAASSSSSSSWAAWDPSNTVAASSSWASWGSASSVKATGASVAASSTWASWAAGSSATGVASYTGSGSGNLPGGIATYQGAGATIKAGGVMVGAFVVGAAALLL